MQVGDILLGMVAPERQGTQPQLPGRRAQAGVRNVTLENVKKGKASGASWKRPENGRQCERLLRGRCGLQQYTLRTD